MLQPGAAPSVRSSIFGVETPCLQGGEETPLIGLRQYTDHATHLSMRLVAQVKLVPTAEQARALRGTMETANAAANAVSATAFAAKTFRQFDIHKLAYADTRRDFPLTAQVVVQVVAKVADAYTLDRKVQRVFRPLGAIAYDARILRWRTDKSSVSIWTLGGRQHISFVCGERQRQLLRSQRGETDLVCVDGTFYLFATCDVEAPIPRDVTDFLGVDLGIATIAADSDGERHCSKKLLALRHRHRRLRTKLQAKRTRSATRLLKRRSAQEARFAKDVNHCISKRLVAKAEGTGRGLALEELTNIRTRITARKPQRATLSSWSFGQLRSFVEYKARRVGVPVVFVDPRNTSRTCPACGLIDKRNRKTQAEFLCVACGHSGHADTIAAENIRRAAFVNQPIVAQCA